MNILTNTFFYSKSFVKNIWVFFINVLIKLKKIKCLQKFNELNVFAGIFPGISVIKEPDSKTIPTSKLLSDLAQDFPNDINKRVNAFLLHKIGSYLNSHAISVRLFDPNVYESTQSYNEETLQNLGVTENKDDKSTGE